VNQSQDLTIQILNYSVPCAFGAFFAIAGLVRKYPTEMKYIYQLVPTWIYILLSSTGSLGFTLFVAYKGARVVDDPIANSFIFGILCPAVFLGIASRVSVFGSSSKGVEKQVKTIQDYIYTILDDAISRKKLQIIELKIKDVGRDTDPDSLLREVARMVDAVTTLTEEQKTKLKLQFDETGFHGEYIPIIRELKKYYEVDYIIKRLSSDVQQGYTRSKLRNLVDIALKAHGLSKSVSHEFIIAEVQALQKDPDSSLHYLEQALHKKPSLKRHILTNETDWWIFASMTCGERQQEKLEKFSKLIGIEQITSEYIKQQCLQQNNFPLTFAAVKRDTGDCVSFTLIKQINQSQSNRWWIRCNGDKRLDKECTDLDDIVGHIEKVTIPMRLI
jgi:hypothetical protein